MAKRLLPILAILAAATVRGLNGIFVQFLSLPVATQTFFRLSTPFVLCLIYLLYKRQPLIPKNRKSMTNISVSNALRMGLLIAGYGFASPTIATATQRVNVFVAIILAYFLLGEKITANKVISMILGFGGVLVIALGTGFSIHNADMYGIILVFLSAILSGYINTKYKAALHTNSIAYLIFYQSFVGTIGFGLYALFFDAAPTVAQVGIGILYSFLIGVVGFGLFFWGMKRMQAGYSSILTYFEIASAALFSYIFFKEVPTFSTTLGILFIVGSGVIVAYGLHKKVKDVPLTTIGE